MKGIVYTESVVHMAPPALAAQAPYQLVIVDLEGGQRRTGRIEGTPVEIGSPVELVEERDGVAIFRKADSYPA
jgi:uncharacterized OB-fold protein